VTPTGAALLSSLAESFIDLPALTIKKVGYGAGKRIMEHPNLLRLILGEDCKTGVPGPINFHGSHERAPRRHHRQGR